jgi:tol-pal system protein YbgF
VPAAPADSTTPVAPPPAPAGASADQMYQGALQLYRRGSVVTARGAWVEFLRTYANHPLVPDAIYYIGETFETSAPDSALARYTEVRTRFPQSPRAPTALYKIGLIAERRKDVALARTTYQRVIQEYPRSEEADLARERLAGLKP